MRNLSPREVNEQLESGRVVLLDVRTPEEVAHAVLPGAVAIPLQELQARHGELPRNRPIIAYCHHGVRSETAARFLLSNGFTDVAHLEGGIDAWSQTIDPTVPRY